MNPMVFGIHRILSIIWILSILGILGALWVLGIQEYSELSESSVSPASSEFSESLESQVLGVFRFLGILRIFRIIGIFRIPRILRVQNHWNSWNLYIYIYTKNPRINLFLLSSNPFLSLISPFAKSVAIGTRNLSAALHVGSEGCGIVPLSGPNMANRVYRTGLFCSYTTTRMFRSCRKAICILLCVSACVHSQSMCLLDRACVSKSLAEKTDDGSKYSCPSSHSSKIRPSCVWGASDISRSPPAWLRHPSPSSLSQPYSHFGLTSVPTSASLP